MTDSATGLAGGIAGVHGGSFARARILATKYGATGLSLAILVAALAEIGRLDLHRIAALVPANPAFWVVFAVAYMAPPVADWAIYNRLWGLPASGVVATLRKTIGNELLCGYAGEAYLFTVARKRGVGVADALRAVRDVSILSAAMGSIATLTAVAIAWPWLGNLNLGLSRPLLAASLAIVAAPPVCALLFRAKMSLPGSMLARIAAIHGLRALTTVTLGAVLWHLALPQVAPTWWVALSAVKLMVSRLPLVSNRELIFAGATGLIVGHAATDLAALMAMMAALTVAANIGMGIVTGLGEAAVAALPRLRAPVAAPLEVAAFA